MKIVIHVTPRRHDKVAARIEQKRIEAAESRRVLAELKDPREGAFLASIELWLDEPTAE